MTGFRRTLVVCTALLAMSLCSPPPASADEEPGKTEVVGPAEVELMEGESSAEKPGEDPGTRENEEEAEEPGNVKILEVDLTPEELWQLTNPWKAEGIVVHDAESRKGERSVRPKKSVSRGTGSMS